MNFADRASGRIYLRLAAGVPVWLDRAALERAMQDSDTRAGLAAIAPGVLTRALETSGTTAPTVLAGERIHTVGHWGEEAPAAAENA